MKIRFIFILILLVHSCTHTPQVKDELIKLTINYDSMVKQPSTITIIGNAFDYSKYLDYSEYVEDDIKLISLESDENKMIGEVSSLKIVGDTIYILDKISHSIFRYNMKGDFISKLSARGKANNEYNELFDNCFYVKDMQLYIVDKYAGKLLIYDKDNNFIKSISLRTDKGDVKYFDCVIEYDGQYCLFNNLGTMADFHISRMDDTGKILSQELPIADFKKSSTWRYGNDKNHLVCFSNNEVFFNFYGIDTIYNFKNGSISPAYVVDFGKYKVTESLMKSSEDLLRIIGDNTIGISKLSFVGKYIILHFRAKGQGNVAIFDNEGNSLGVSSMFRYKDGLNYIGLNSPHFADDYSVTVIKPFDGLWAENYKKQLVKYINGGDYLDYFSRVMESYDFNSGNPMLLIQKWKK